MEPIDGKIYIATVLLEANRWAAVRQPTYRVSRWLDRFAQAGFDGIELWENHAAMAPPGELEALSASPVPVTVFNSYAGFDDESASQRRRTAELAAALAAPAVKFNLGPDPQRREEYISNALAWRKLLGADVRMLCECHGGTILETPAAASEVFDRWDHEQFQAIVHPFSCPPAALAEWFDRLAERVTHAHVQTRDADNRFTRLTDNAAGVREALAVLSEKGYRGSYTLEFTAGTGQANEDIESLFAAALDDLAFLRENFRP